MDDQQFDDSVKRKVGDYEDPGFDPAALAALHRQMASVSVVPWYSQYRTELLAGAGLLVSTLIILWSQWFMSTNATEMLSEKIITLQTQQAEIDKLQNQISALKNVPPDTIRIIEIRELPSSYYASLLYRIKLLEAANSNNNSAIREIGTHSESTSESEKQDSTFDTKYAWSPQSQNVLFNADRNLFSLKVAPRTTKKESAHAVPSIETKVTQSSAQNLSAKTLRDLEKHYQKGVGIRLGPAVEISKGFYNVGSGIFNITGGVLADFILSPSISLETGVKFVKRVYEVTGKGLSKIEPVRVDNSQGALISTDVDSWIMEIPLSLKYRYPQSIKMHWLGGIGYTSLLYTKQLLEHGYQVDGNPNISIVSSFKDKRLRTYPGMLHFSLGISNQLKSKKILETSLFYQQGLGKAGLERNTANFLGVRAVYWFTLR